MKAATPVQRPNLIRQAEAAEKRLAAKRARRSAAFRAASHSGNFYTQLAVVTPIARGNVLNAGIDTDNLIDDVAGLVGMKRGGHGAGADWSDYCDALNAAFALGVATGQMLTPGFFGKAGAK